MDRIKIGLIYKHVILHSYLDFITALGRQTHYNTQNRIHSGGCLIEVWV